MNVMTNAAHQHDRYCLSCRHSLRGIHSERCPECGRPFDPDDPATFATSLRRPQNALGCWFLAILLYPLVPLALLYMTWLVAAISIGYWPRPYR